MLRRHCETEGRDYDEIEKTALYRFDAGPRGENVDAILAHLKDLAALGVDHVHSRGLDGSRTDWLEVIGEQIIPGDQSILSNGRTSAASRSICSASS